MGRKEARCNTPCLIPQNQANRYREQRRAQRHLEVAEQQEVDGFRAVVSEQQLAL